MMTNGAKIYLDKLYQDIGGCSNAVSLCSSYSAILQIKHENAELSDYNHSLYVDIKCFLEEYVSMVSYEKRDFGYDSVDQNKLEKFISFCSNNNQRNELYRYAYKQLLSRGFNNEADFFYEKYLKGRAILQLQQGSLFKKMIGIISLVVSNVWICMLTVVGALILHFIILLPYSDASHAAFEISYYSYNENFYINHLLNLLADMFGISETHFCKPLGIIGMLINICFKLFYMLFVGGVFIDNLKKEIR